MELELEILKFICANQGSVNTEELLCNLGSGDATADIITNREKFAFCSPFGQSKVVARTWLRLCLVKDCPGACTGLHLCKKFLLTGSCQFTRTRTGCRFSHGLDSFHNAAKLTEHGLESLSRSELCTLLLQSDTRLLPQICHNYNKGGGRMGLCQEGDNCTRLHICEKYLNSVCSCIKNHDFNAPQPQKSLSDRGVPDQLFPSLMSAYANLLALKYADRQGDPDARGSDGLIPPQRERQRGRGRAGFRGNPGNRGNRGNMGNRGNRGFRGNGGNRGNRGNQGNQPTRSTDEVLADSPYVSAAANDTDASSDDGKSRKPNLNKTSAAVRGRGGDSGNHQPLNRSRATADPESVSDDANSEDGARRRPRPVRDKTEICMFFIKGHCKHEEGCYKAHNKMPYSWQVLLDDQWTALPNNETIEKDYCDPKNTYSSSNLPVDFDTMTQGANKVRRLSTSNSLVDVSFLHTTEWVWYWEDEHASWTMYASRSGGHSAADTGSAELEQKFLDNAKDVVEFSAGSQAYSLSFQDLIQTNKQYGTKRVVKRRPRFVSAADVRAKNTRRPLAQPGTVPDHWDKTQISQTGYKTVSLHRTSDEYLEIETLFCNTMRGFDIVKIERIQNKALWEAFQLKNKQMKDNNNGHNVTEKKLFHGTKSEYVAVICHKNFDWRVCGVNGTAFGQGSYFARDAKYSHSYTEDSHVKSMFVSRVLVGDYTRGSSSYRKPPSKDGGVINLYDSCVDDEIKPSIFVVFDSNQIYPEYLLQYKSTHPLVSLVAASAPAPVPAPIRVPAQILVPALTPVPAPRPAPKPSVTSYQSSTSTYQTSTSSYRPSTPSYLPSTPSYQPSTSTNYPSVSRTPRFSPSPPPTTVNRTPRFSPSPPPTPSPKKSSDSCVIA
ncbi:hypothetical protein OYC64_006781 [Pagothenia borchgrevinki]|uniref:Uncharacterized protein n=1 Tax=Pagothenia borchgrevinki TaxID=8213 RepID=A0ABD2G357_PAGBO